MSDNENLESLSSRELHDKAFSHAVKHLDVGFFLRLLAFTPAARAGVGDIEESENDVLRSSSLIAEAVDQDPDLLDAMRPVYLEYLQGS